MHCPPKKLAVVERWPLVRLYLGEISSCLHYPGKPPQHPQIQFFKGVGRFTHRHKCSRSKTPQSESCCLSKTRNLLTQYADNLETNVDIRPGYTRQKIKKKSNESQGRQANPCKSTMRCVSFLVLHVPSPSPVKGAAQNSPK